MPLIFMYLMFRQLEIYWLFEDGIVMQRVRNSGHDEVFKNNMVTGIMLFTCSLISIKSSVAIPLFLAGLSNFVISSYYVKTLKKILKIPCKSKGH